MDAYTENLMKLCGKNVDLKLRGKVEVFLRGELSYNGNGLWQVQFTRATVTFTLDSIYSLINDQIVLE